MRSKLYLDYPESIIFHKWEKDITPLVSISCITYNHEKYIRSAIEGFLSQKTTFRIEILIHDDASTDSTADIIREYEKKYPDLIFPIYQSENRYSQGMKIGVNFQYPRARGKYIAKCEGDDYWTDQYKLQKQIEFLENNPEYSACFTNAFTLDEIKANKKIYVSQIPEGEVNIDEILVKGGWIYPSASIVYRRNCLDIELIKAIPEIAGDSLMIISLAMKGKVFFLNEFSCIYRRWNGGVYSSIENDKKKISEWKKTEIAGYKKLGKYIDDEYRKIIRKKISADSHYVLKHGRGLSRFKYLKDLDREYSIQFLKYEIKSLLGERASRKLSTYAKAVLSRFNN